MFFSQNSPTAEQFMSEDWQRRVRFFPAKDNSFKTPISPDELAGLALEPEVESRLITKQGDQWHLRRGPLTANDYQQHGSWSLLVQNVDKLLPEIEALWSLVDFIPRWRRDDIMISYATKGGGVGPHFDRYDVFLLQAAGARRWHIGQHCDEHTALRQDSDLCLLSNFSTVETYDCKTGDVLYIPPGVAHWGEASDDNCMTFSFGFRAPRQSDLLARLCDTALESINPLELWEDPQRGIANSSGEISDSDIQRARQQLIQRLQNTEISPRWFGEIATHQTNADDWTLSDDDAEQVVETAHDLYLNPEAQVAWHRHKQDLLVFSNGYTIETSPEMQTLLNDIVRAGELDHLTLEQYRSDSDKKALLLALVSTGALME